jgi:hypothetical protein
MVPCEVDESSELERGELMRVRVQVDGYSPLDPTRGIMGGTKFNHTHFDDGVYDGRHGVRVYARAIRLFKSSQSYCSMLILG